VFFRLGVVSMLVAIWHGGCTLASKRGGYGGVLVRWGWDMIPGVLGPDIVFLGEEPGFVGKTRDGCEREGRHLP
jgi:hypothetical protein